MYPDNIRWSAPATVSADWPSPSPRMDMVSSLQVSVGHALRTTTIETSQISSIHPFGRSGHQIGPQLDPSNRLYTFGMSGTPQNQPICKADMTTLIDRRALVKTHRSVGRLLGLARAYSWRCFNAPPERPNPTI